MNDEEHNADPFRVVSWSGGWTCNSGGDLDRYRELLVGVVVVSELTILSEERLFQGFLL